MKTKHILAILVFAAAVALLALMPNLASGGPTVPPEPEIITVYVEKPTLSPEQIIWFARLMDCESGIKEWAVNPVDLDNTPSLGLLQFKTGTFAAFTAKYGLEGDIMDGVTQVKIVTEWLLNPGAVDWTMQFPWCVEKLGLPPQ